MIDGDFGIVRSFSTDTTSQLDILWHDGDTLGMDGTQVGVLEEGDKVSLSSFLEGQDSCRLEAQISLEVLCNFSHYKNGIDNHENNTQKE